MGTLDARYIEAIDITPSMYHYRNLHIRNRMIIHLPTGKTFSNRKEAKIYFGTAYYYKLEEEKRDLLFTHDIQSATNEYGKINTHKLQE